VVPQSWQPNHLDFAPRLGLAWDIAGRGKNVIRAGYGIGYDRWQLSILPAIATTRR